MTGFLSSKTNSSRSGLVIIIGLVACFNHHIMMIERFEYLVKRPSKQYYSAKKEYKPRIKHSLPGDQAVSDCG